MGGSKPPYSNLLQDVLVNPSPAICFAGGVGAVVGPRQREPFAGLQDCTSCACEGSAPALPWPDLGGQQLWHWGHAWRGTPGQELIASDLCTAAALDKF